MSTNKCDEEVFAKGSLIGIFDMPRDEAETYCTQATKRTGRKHDWYYAAGRVVIKALPPAIEYQI